MIILLHSSKTMRVADSRNTTAPTDGRVPQFIDQAHELNNYLRGLPGDVIAQSMHIGGKVAARTVQQIKDWSSDQATLPAIDSFIGDIYSGLQVQELDENDREYADQTLRVLSGLYGVLRPLDHIRPYRLEMGYRLPDEPYKNLYKFWGRRIYASLPAEGPIINTSSVEYTKVITDFVDPKRIITPQFMTISPKTGEPTFVVVHAKIARGAYARWLIKKRITDTSRLSEFNELNYTYEPNLSTPNYPVYVCPSFGGLGLSVRLT